ncbi:RAMP superfamily CRISPR-associated protein [Gordonia sp. NPDC062954]|uniref:RAMP superfamily CRISPR-associated protein n=1 Tax=Gordonia sp. NPDC062954 TaxID=3364003 RepID=UPI0037CAE935
MGRQVDFFKVRLEFVESGGVLAEQIPVGAEPESTLQLCLETDFTKRAHLPPTTVAGSLRAHVAAQRDASEARRYFGHAPDAEDDERAVSSMIAVLGTRACDGGQKEERSRTAISAHTGAPTPGSLRRAELATAGTAWDISFRCDRATRDDIDDLTSLLRSWRPIIGRGATVGHGQAKVLAVAHGRLDLGNPADLLSYLNSGGPILVDDVVGAYDFDPQNEGSDPTDDPAELYELVCEIVGPIHVGDGSRTPRGEPSRIVRVDGKPIMLASSVKGVLRSRMSYILRSVRKDGEWCSCTEDDYCVICHAFGFTDRQSRASRARYSYRGRLRFFDSPIDGEPSVRINSPIDRFTGGAAHQTWPGGSDQAGDHRFWSRSGLLHSLEVMETGRFRIRIDDLGFDDQHHGDVFKALLRLTVEDINDGHVTFGRGGTRGFGRVNIGNADDALVPLSEAQATLRTLIDQEDRTRDDTLA